MLVLLFVALWFILRGDCVFLVLLVLRLPRLEKRELILVLFVRLFGLCLFSCRFPLPLGVWEGLRFVIVALPGLFSYLFYIPSIVKMAIIDLVNSIDSFFFGGGGGVSGWVGRGGRGSS